MSNPKSPIAPFAYVALATARQIDENSKPRFSVTQVYPEGTNLSEMKKVAGAAAAKKFPQGIPKNIRSPFRLGESKRREDGTMPEGFSPTDTFVEFWRYEKDGQVPCVDQLKNAMLPSDVYSGMTGRVAYRCSAYDYNGNKGVSFHVEAVQKAGDGTPIGAAPVNPQTEFDDLPVEGVVLEEEDINAAF